VSIAEQLRELEIGFEYCREVVVLGGSTLQAREVLCSQLHIGSGTSQPVPLKTSVRPVIIEIALTFVMGPGPLDQNALPTRTLICRSLM